MFTMDAAVYVANIRFILYTLLILMLQRLSTCRKCCTTWGATISTGKISKRKVRLVSTTSAKRWPQRYRRYRNPVATTEQIDRLTFCSGCNITPSYLQTHIDDLRFFFFFILVRHASKAHVSDDNIHPVYTALTARTQYYILFTCIFSWKIYIFR